MFPTSPNPTPDPLGARAEAPPFAADIRHWPTPDAFRAHLAAHDPAIAAWAGGVTIHHTYRPLPSQWRGYDSLVGLRNYYQHTKGWPSGPHLFLCAGAPNPAHDGIWQLSPLDRPGTHAGACNTSTWGIEVIGDYTHRPWPEAVAALVQEVGTALLRWRGLAISLATVRGHRECMDGRTCPGDAIDLDAVRATWARAWTDAPAPITADSLICAPSRCTMAQALAYSTSRPGPHNYTRADLALTILPAYWSLCPAVDADPCVTLAQAIHEGALTSFWGRRPQRNPAGIGVNGRFSAAPPPDATDWAYNTDRQRWEAGLSFPSWAGHAIPAHVGRLVAFATRPADRSPAQAQLVTAALQRRPLPAKLHGSAPTLRELGRVHNRAGQGWASPGTHYGAQIAEIAQAMRETQEGRG